MNLARRGTFNRPSLEDLPGGESKFWSVTSFIMTFVFSRGIYKSCVENRQEYRVCHLELYIKKVEYDMGEINNSIVKKK